MKTWESMVGSNVMVQLKDGQILIMPTLAPDGTTVPLMGSGEGGAATFAQSPCVWGRLIEVEPEKDLSAQVITRIDAGQILMISSAKPGTILSLA
jgi:hypothetical protein